MREETPDDSKRKKRPAFSVEVVASDKVIDLEAWAEKFVRLVLKLEYPNGFAGTGGWTMEYKGYVARVEYDEDEKTLHGRVDNVGVVITFMADRVEDVEREFRASVDEYLKVCAERGLEPEQPSA